MFIACKPMQVYLAVMVKKDMRSMLNEMNEFKAVMLVYF